MSKRLPSDSSIRSPSNGGFTLIELLSVIAIIGTLAVLLFPTFTKIQRAAQSTTELNNLRQLADGAYKYAQDQNGVYFGNGKDSPQLWIMAFWPYVYPNRPNPNPNFSAADSGAVYKGTVFYTPLLEKTPVYGGQPRSFGYNYPVEQAYGVNLRYDLLVSKRSAVALFGDTKTSGSWIPAQVNARYNNSVHVAFLDQHAALIPLKNIPTTNSDIFWSGK